MNRLAPIVLFVAVSACATSVETCRKNAFERVSMIDAEIAEIEATLDRGYRLNNRTVSTVGIGFCAGDNLRFCAEGTQAIPPKAVPIDRAVEESRLRSLRASRNAALIDANVAAAACSA